MIEVTSDVPNTPSSIRFSSTVSARPTPRRVAWFSGFR